ncbi:MAG: T9SS type A sorting domain-containing protein [Bacteroidota bacterium]
MRTRITIFSLMSMILGVFAVNAQTVNNAALTTDTVNVTFLINTSTIPDTLRSTSTVQVRGSMLPLTWDDTTGVRATNIGGDYWTATAKFLLNRGDTAKVRYKFFTNVNDSVSKTDGGWENNISGIYAIDSNNRALRFGPYTGNKDTTIALQYANGRTAQVQWWKPYVPSDDSVAVMFRVNMQSDEGFSKTTMKMGVRGSMAPLSWNTTIFLTKEASHGNGGQTAYDGTNFWSRVIKFPKSAAADTVHYKFVILPSTADSSADPAYENDIAAAPDVGGDGYRFFKFRPDMPDTTLYWKWWQNTPVPPFSGKDVVAVTFRADLAQAITENGFTYSDTLVVRTGYNNSAVTIREKRLLRVGTSSKYSGTDYPTTILGTPLYYQYYRTPKSGDVREIYYNFANPGTSAYAEKRRFMMSSKTLTIQDTVYSTSDEHRMPRFQNMKKLSQPVLVTYTCDVRPAIYQLKAGDTLKATNITTYDIADPDSVLLYGVWMNGPAVGGWDIGGAWGADRRLLDSCKMWDDGTHGDLHANDSIFTLQKAYTTAVTVGQEFKFGIYGCDNEGGYGNNHIENINDANPTDTIASQFGSIDPVFFNAWDYTNHCPAAPNTIKGAAGTPLVYKLEQNYPNPFNPSTKIDYEIKQAGIVTIKVFNVLGQVVAKPMDVKQEAGKHSIIFDASRLSTGLYFYQITAGNFIATKKMILLK